MAEPRNAGGGISAAQSLRLTQISKANAHLCDVLFIPGERLGMCLASAPNERTCKMVNPARTFAIGITAATLILAGCANPDGTYNQTGTGLLVGGLAGAATGQAIGGTPESTLIGGAIGAAVGGAIGANMAQQERELRRSLAGTGADITNTGSYLMVSLPESVTFRTASAVVDPSFRPALRSVAESLRRHPNSSVRVIGHTDNVGTASYNAQLSQERAMAVARELIVAGTPGGRISVSGRGYNEPIASNQTAAGRAQNRRVEIIITPNN
jgi:outer membrane protein OmpA-like peptidoglycan-associated protein